MLPVGKLFYNFLAELLNASRISASEIEELKTLEYTKTLFPSTDYPAIADNRSENVGKSGVKRYRAKELKCDNVNIYVSTQFYESDRDIVIAWYKSHLA